MVLTDFVKIDYSFSKRRRILYFFSGFAGYPLRLSVSFFSFSHPVPLVFRAVSNLARPDLLVQTGMRCDDGVGWWIYIEEEQRLHNRMEMDGMV